MYGEVRGDGLKSILYFRFGLMIVGRLCSTENSVQTLYIGV